MTYAHLSQYGAAASVVTRTSGCTWTAGASGAAATTGGSKHPSADAVHHLVARSEETSPATPGWSLPDLALAMERLGVPFLNHSGSGWAEAVAQLASGHYLVLQGVSAVFANATCSGDFNGDHAIGVHPLAETEDGVLWRWIDDPICPDGRWEKDSVLRRYAEALSPTVRFGAFVDPVPKEAPVRDFEILVGPDGLPIVAMVTVNPDAPHKFLRLADGTLGNASTNWAPKAAILIRLTEDITATAHPGVDRRTGWQIGTRAAFLLKQDAIAVYPGTYTDGFAKAKADALAAVQGI